MSSRRQIAQHAAALLLDQFRAHDFRSAQLQLVAEDFADRIKVVRRKPIDHLTAKQSPGRLRKMPAQILTGVRREAIAHDQVPHHHPIRQRLSDQEFRELLVAENVIHHCRNARDTFRRRTIGIVREREELFQRFGVAARRTPGVRGVIESSPARELFDLRRPGRILLTRRQIFLGKMKATIGIIRHPGLLRLRRRRGGQHDYEKDDFESNKIANPTLHFRLAFNSVTRSPRHTTW